MSNMFTQFRYRGTCSHSCYNIYTDKQTSETPT